MKEILRNRKWQLLSLVLATALITSISLNIYQSFNASNQCSDENSPSNGDANKQMNFTFTWGPETQDIINGTFHLEMLLRWGVVPNSPHKWLSMMVKINDDEYNPCDYLGIVFDINENGVIDLGSADGPFGLWTNNMTAPSVLLENGFLCFAECMPTQGPHTCTFEPDTGYMFSIFFPSLPSEGPPPNPAEVLREGCENSLHVCFNDANGGRVFVRFAFLAHALGD
jgi:hypothetical protein